MTSVCVGGEGGREVSDTRRRAGGSPTLDTLGLVISLAAKALETGWHGQVLDVTRWHDDLTKTGSDLHGRARNGTHCHR